MLIYDKMFTAIEYASNRLRLRIPSSNNVETMLVQYAGLSKRMVVHHVVYNVGS
jgi:hypothetical protein